MKPLIPGHIPASFPILRLDASRTDRPPRKQSDDLAGVCGVGQRTSASPPAEGGWFQTPLISHGASISAHAVDRTVSPHPTIRSPFDSALESGHCGSILPDKPFETRLAAWRLFALRGSVSPLVISEPIITSVDKPLKE